MLRYSLMILNIYRALTLIFNVRSLDLPLTYKLLQAATVQDHQQVLLLIYMYKDIYEAHRHGDKPEDDSRLEPEPEQPACH